MRLPRGGAERSLSTLPLHHHSLQRCELYTCTLEAVRRRIPALTTTATTVLLPADVGVLQQLPSDQGGGPGGSEGESLGRGGSADEAMADAAGGQGGGQGAAESYSSGDEDDEEEDEEGSEDESGSERRKGGKGKGGKRGQRRGTGNPGAPARAAVLCWGPAAHSLLGVVQQLVQQLAAVLTWPSARSPHPLQASQA